MIDDAIAKLTLRIVECNTAITALQVRITKLEGDLETHKTYGHNH